MDNIGLFLANKLKCIDMPAPKYELIETISITESDIFTISRTAEPNGNAYNFDKMIVKINVPGVHQSADILVSTTNILKIRFNNGIAYVPGGGNNMFAEIDVSEGIKKVRFSDVVTSGSTCSIHSKETYNTLTNSKLSSLTISTSDSTVAFPTGSDITIYAARC